MRLALDGQTSKVEALQGEADDLRRCLGDMMAEVGPRRLQPGLGQLRGGGPGLVQVLGLSHGRPMSTVCCPLFLPGSRQVSFQLPRPRTMSMLASFSDTHADLALGQSFLCCECLSVPPPVQWTHGPGRVFSSSSSVF